MDESQAILGYYAAVHRALTEPILLGGAPRAVAIVNGTLAAVIGLGLRLWIAGAAIGSSAISPRSGPPSATRPLLRSSAGIYATRSTWSREARGMMNLAEYRRKSQDLADFLPWAALMAKGIILNKDGSFQRTARFRGPDLDSATAAELVAITRRLNNALRRLGSGWAIFVEA